MTYLKAILLIAVLFTVGFGASQYSYKNDTEKRVDKVKSIQTVNDLKSEVRDLSGFDGVAIGGTIMGSITVGQEFKVVVEAKEDILSEVITEVKNDVLVVKFKKDFWKNRSYKSRNIKVRVTISLPALKDLDVSGASKASVTGVNSEKLMIDVSGASNVDIEGFARVIDVDLSGASNLMARNLMSEVAEMDLSGASSAKVNVSSSIRVDASGASSVRYAGEPQIQKDTSGASSVIRQ